MSAFAKVVSVERTARSSLAKTIVVITVFVNNLKGFANAILDLLAWIVGRMSVPTSAVATAFATGVAVTVSMTSLELIVHSRSVPWIAVLEGHATSCLVLANVSRHTTERLAIKCSQRGRTFCPPRRSMTQRTSPFPTLIPLTYFFEYSSIPNALTLIRGWLRTREQPKMFSPKFREWVPSTSIFTQLSASLSLRRERTDSRLLKGTPFALPPLASFAWWLWESPLRTKFGRDSMKLVKPVLYLDRFRVFARVLSVQFVQPLLF